MRVVSVAHMPSRSLLYNLSPHTFPSHTHPPPVPTPHHTHLPENSFPYKATRNRLTDQKLLDRLHWDKKRKVSSKSFSWVSCSCQTLSSSVQASACIKSLFMLRVCNSHNIQFLLPSSQQFDVGNQLCSCLAGRSCCRLVDVVQALKLLLLEETEYQMRLPARYCTL